MATNGASGFGHLLRRYRIAAALSQESLAEAAGLSARGVSDLERGLRVAPRLETVRLLAEALQLAPDERAALVAASRAVPTAPDAERAVATIAALPLPLTSLIGRTAEIAAVRDLLAQSELRLVTVTGPGGVGKTRLALAVAAAAHDAFPEGVWFVDLTPLTDPALVPAAIAQALGVHEETTGIIERLATALSGKRALLILDNVARLVAAAPSLAELLGRASGLTVLATSRIPLRLYGERAFSLVPLSLPPPGATATPESVRRSEAVRLFMERAQAARADFALTPANAAAVAEICIRLDGLPLAIELVATRVKVLSLATLAQRLERRLPLLTGGARTLPIRQQTMRDAIAWSHDLLPLDEQALFRRLAVFAGGFTLTAAEQVVVDPKGTRDVLDGLIDLIDASLLRQRDEDGDSRYTMLETIREFGLEQLEASGEAPALRDRHAEWCIGVAESLGADVPTAISIGADIPTAEMANLRTVIAWLLETKRFIQALRLVTASEVFWEDRSRHSEVAAWLAAIIPNVMDAPAADLFAGHHQWFYARCMVGDLDGAMALAHEYLARARVADMPMHIVRAQFDIGLVWEYRGEVARSAAAYAKTLPLLSQVDDPFWAYWPLADLGDKLVWLGELERAVPLLDEALVGLRRLGEPFGLAMALGQRGYAALAQGELPAAARWFAESIDIGRRGRKDRAVWGAVAGLAGVALARGEAARAARLLGAVDAARRTIAFGVIAHPLHVDRVIMMARQPLSETEFSTSWNAGQALGVEAATRDALAVAVEIENGMAALIPSAMEDESAE